MVHVSLSVGTLFCFHYRFPNFQNFKKLHLLHYSDATLESTIITSFIWACNILCIITLVMTPHNDHGYD
jgi:hypothetical protein